MMSSINMMISISTMSSINKIHHQSQHSLQLGAFDIGFQFGNKIFEV